jgi:hypothetical protein
VLVLALVFFVFNATLNAFLRDQHAAVTAFATIAIAVFTIVLAGVTYEQMKLTREALTARRAAVFALDLHAEWEPGSAGHISWRFRPKWKNSGETATKHLKLYTECELRNSELPKGFEFRSRPENVYNGFIGPQQEILGIAGPLQPASPISAADLVAVRQNTRFLYLWGWVTYQDVFARTPQHVTHFCWQLSFAGDPLTYDPLATGQGGVHAGALDFSWNQHSEGNCSDDECIGLPRL